MTTVPDLDGQPGACAGAAKLFEHSFRFNHSWDTTTVANWRKYPNDLSTHVLSVDILSRSVDPQTGILRTERLLCCKQNAPAILRRVGLPIPEVAYFREISELDPHERSYTATSVNLSLRNIMTVEETVIIRDCKGATSEDGTVGADSLAATATTSASAPSSLSSWFTRAPSLTTQPSTPASEFTEFIQQAKFRACGFATLARLIEDAAVTRFQANALVGRRALEMVIEKVVEEARIMEGKVKGGVNELVDGLNGLRKEGARL
ncbi:hypothetical protein HK101_009117 [Irineochytrium annulatum]|nr:hypothetical protein HK101_009117 [Irineochytrium annulatum]